MSPARDPAARPRRVVLTGGPAAGKTAVAEVLLRQLADQVAVLPESATILFSGGFPRPTEPAGRRAVQRAVFGVQRELEAIFAVSHPELPQICDRGSLDGAAYWPDGLKGFLRGLGTSLEEEYARYDAVLFLESSAWEETCYPAAATSVRIETPAQARRLDTRLRKLWESHPGFHLVSHQARFYEKVADVLITLHRVLGVRT